MVGGAGEMAIDKVVKTVVVVMLVVAVSGRLASCRRRANMVQWKLTEW